jgi:hypothetical protein
MDWKWDSSSFVDRPPTRAMARSSVLPVFLLLTALVLASAFDILRVTPQSASAQTCTGTIYLGVCFPQGADSFADETVSIVRSTGFGSQTPSGNASSVLGPPNAAPGVPAPNLALGNGGCVTVHFTNNALTGSGNTGTADGILDLWIFETGALTEHTLVSVSADGSVFTSVGGTLGGTGGIDIDAFGFTAGNALQPHGK